MYINGIKAINILKKYFQSILFLFSPIFSLAPNKSAIVINTIDAIVIISFGYDHFSLIKSIVINPIANPNPYIL